MRGPLTSRGAGGGRGGRRGDLGPPGGGQGEREVEDGAVPLWVVIGLLLLPAVSSCDGFCAPPSIGSLGPVHRRCALAPAAAHAEPSGHLLIRRTIAAAGGLLGHRGARPEGGGLPAARPEADLDLSEPGLAEGGGAQQAGAAHGEQQRQQPGASPRLSSSPSGGSLSSFPIPWLLNPALPPSLPPSFLPFLFSDASPLRARLPHACMQAWSRVAHHQSDLSLLPSHYLVSKTLLSPLDMKDATPALANWRPFMPDFWGYKLAGVIGSRSLWSPASLSLTGNTDCITEASAAQQHSRTPTPTRKP